MLISPPRGFSIFEVLIVIAIIGISTLLISISISSSEKKKFLKRPLDLALLSKPSLIEQLFSEDR